MSSFPSNTSQMESAAITPLAMLLSTPCRLAMFIAPIASPTNTPPGKLSTNRYM